MIFQIKTLEKFEKKTRQQGYMPKNIHVEGRAMYQASSSQPYGSEAGSLSRPETYQFTKTGWLP